jgi:hypothetical protein
VTPLAVTFGENAQVYEEPIEGDFHGCIHAISSRIDQRDEALIVRLRCDRLAWNAVEGAFAER